uniref:Uncharacterized protein n=1 Tax=Helianthus annuus TaxID=4232 RepID=A0A251V8V5_HELAN
MEIWNEHMFKPYNTKRFRNLYACFWVLVLLLGVKEESSNTSQAGGVQDRGKAPL